MANVVRTWKKFMAVGCSHGHHADQALLSKVLAFKKRWKPHTTLHLGDAIDLACLRAGAAGTADDAIDPESDLNDGLTFLSRLEPQVYFLGNHEARLNTLMESPRAIVSALAARVMTQITDRARAMKCSVVDYNFQQGWRLYGDALFGHGYMANENAVRDHAVQRIRNGESIHGWQMVPKRATRKWTNEDAALQALTDAGIDKSKLVLTEMVTPAVAEKLLGKDKKSMVDDLTTKESTGLTLGRAVEFAQ